MMRWQPSSIRCGLATLMVAVTLAGCAADGASPGASGPTASFGPTGSAVPGTPSVSGSTAAIAATGSVADATGDATPGYIDIVSMRATATGGQLILDLRVAAPVPASSVEAGLLAYAFALDTNGDRTADVSASLQTVPEGGFRPVLIDTATGGRREGADFPGSASLSGAEITISLSLDAIGCPASVGIRGSAERTKGGTTTRDDTPDTPTDWVTVATDC